MSQTGHLLKLEGLPEAKWDDEFLWYEIDIDDEITVYFELPEDISDLSNSEREQVVENYQTVVSKLNQYPRQAAEKSFELAQNWGYLRDEEYLEGQYSVCTLRIRETLGSCEVGFISEDNIFRDHSIDTYLNKKGDIESVRLSG